MQKQCAGWHSKPTFPGGSMNRYLTWLLLLGIVFAVDVKEKVKKKFTVTGVVQNSAGEGIKKVKLKIINEEGKEIADGKSKGDGEFKFKKIRAGSYTIRGEHKKEGSGEVKFTLKTTDVDLTLRISTGEIADAHSQSDSETGMTKEPVMLPQQRPKPAKEYYGTERIEVAPKTAGGDLFVPGGLNEDYDPPEITDTDILNQLLNRFDDESKWTINGDDSNTDEIINDMEDLDFGGIEDTAYPDHPSVGVPASIKGTDLNGIPYETSAPQKAKSSRYDEGQDTEATFGFLDNDNDKDRRRLIGEFINGKTRVVEKTTKK